MKDVRKIIITHVHADHTANVLKIQKVAKEAKIYAHELEKPFLERTKRLPYRKISQKILWTLAGLIFRDPKLKVDVTLKEGDIIDVLGGFKVIHTPGHTPGSMALYNSERGMLISGDSLFNDRQLHIAKGFVNVND